MHRQRSTGSTERGCNSQNMDKRKIAVNTGCVCLIILFIFGFYQSIQWDNTSRRGQEEAKKQKELDEAEAEEKAYERAKEYMENYRISLQELRISEYLMSNTIRARIPAFTITGTMILTISIFIMN